MEKDLILFIPGLGGKERDKYAKKLSKGINNYCTQNGLDNNIIEKPQMDGSISRTIHIPTQQRSIDIKEVFWSDLAPQLSSESILKKVVRGFSLLWFWVFAPKVWKAIRGNAYMLLSMVVSIVLILLWYYGAIATGFKAVAENPQFFNFELHNNSIKLLGEIGDNLSGWNVWLTASVLLIIMPVTEILDISYFTKSYLQNRESVFNKIFGRISHAFHAIVNSDEQYDHILIVSHSFGVVASVEFLAELDNEAMKKFRLITLGGPLKIMAAKEPRIQKSINKLALNNNLESWSDFYSNQDWLCTLSPVPKETKKYTAHSLSSSVSFDQKLNGASHDLYFEDREVMKSIIDIN